MYFYVDETGHTGPNLFDESQPVLSYGVLSCKHDINKVAERTVIKLRKKLGVDRLHAAELGMHRLSEVTDEILALQKQFKFRFDIWQVNKKDHAIISFYDQVFDQGINPAVTWTSYWTPLRYVLLIKIAYLFDDELAKKAWTARLEANDDKSQALFSEVCETLLNRVSVIPDERSRTLITDGLRWANAHFKQLGYNCKQNKEKLQIMPNMVGFQSVIHGICARLNGPNRRAEIVVDQQSQFNTTQKELSEFYYQIREQPWAIGPGLPVMDLRNMPAKPLVFLSSTKNIGLELVDCYLWIFKQYIAKKDLPKSLERFVYVNRNISKTSIISLDAIQDRSLEFFENLPEPTEEMMNKAKELTAMEEARRLQHCV
ncbi:DUF3800 domain-containing protein [Aeromonas veronii]